MAFLMSISQANSGGGGYDNVYRLPLVEAIDEETGDTYLRGTAVRVDRAEYVPHVEIVPGMKARFRITGMTEPEEMAVSPEYARYDGQMQWKFRLEFEVVKGGTNQAKTLEGRRFSYMYTYSVNERSALARLISAIDPDWQTRNGGVFNPNLYLGAEFVTKAKSQEKDRNKFGGLSAEAIEEEKTVLPGAVTGERELVTAGVVGAGGEEESPFDEDL